MFIVSSFSFEELIDLQDKERMSFTGLRPQNNSDSPCSPCLYGGFCECFAPHGILKYCEPLKIKYCSIVNSKEVLKCRKHD
jgi:hypothetical protein